jgi:hypothetical protein
MSENIPMEKIDNVSAEEQKSADKEEESELNSSRESSLGIPSSDNFLSSSSPDSPPKMRKKRRKRVVRSYYDSQCYAMPDCGEDLHDKPRARYSLPSSPKNSSSELIWKSLAIASCCTVVIGVASVLTLMIVLPRTNQG